ncbi:MAG: PAS domain S-box protein [Thermodesulfobacteriota bacterium]
MGKPLKVQENIAKLFLENTSSMVSVFDRDAHFLYVNTPNEMTLGYTPSELHGTNAFDLVHPEDRDRLASLLARAFAGEIDKIRDLHYRIVNKQGQVRHIQATFDTIRDGTGRLDKLLCVADDISDKVEMENAFARSEQRLRAVMDTAPIAIAEVDCHGRFQFVNAAYCETFEYSAEELEAMSVRDLAVSVESGDRLMSMLERLVAEQPAPERWEGRNRTRSGKVLDVVVDWNYKKDERGRVTGFVTAISDITGQKKMSEALVQSRQRYQAMFNHIASGVVVYQPVNNGEDFVVVDFNRTAEQIEGMAAEAVIGRRVTEIFPGIKEMGLLDVLARVSESGRPMHHPACFYKDGRISGWRSNYVYRLATGEVVAVYNDETERVRAREALRESELRFRALVEYSADHIFMLNREGEYLFSNERLEHFPPGRGDSPIGRRLEDLYPPDLADRYRRLVAQVLANGSGTTFEYEREGVEGLNYYVETLYPIYKDGQPWAVGGICRDVTTRKQYERELQQKTGELEKALRELRQAQRRFVDQERQRALSQMASGIAHDFNNALSSIQGFSDLLIQSPEKFSNTDLVKRYVGLINTAARDAAQVVRRLRKFYRPSDEEIIEPVDINRLVEEAVALTEPVWKHNSQARGAPITVQTDFQKDLTASGNRTELNEALTNLIFNAVDAMPRGGTIRFTTRREEGWAVLEVADTGIGMDEAVRRQCMNPFFTTKGEAGSGLGLATVQGIVTRHHGQIELDSQPGRGTTFILRLPAATLRGEKRLATAEDALKGERSSLKVLVVDDDEHQRLLLSEYLKKDLHRPETAQNGIEGMQKFADGWFDLVITDRAMPEMNGDALARNIKKAAPGKPVIMVTGFGDMMEASGETPADVDMVLAKPISLERLRHAMRRVMTGTTAP